MLQPVINTLLAPLDAYLGEKAKEKFEKKLSSKGIDYQVKLCEKDKKFNKSSHDSDIEYAVLHIATFLNLFEHVKTIIDLKADINLPTSKGDTPLHIAVREGHEEITYFLLQKNADVNVEGRAGETPLHIASRKENIKLAMLLLKKEAIIYEQDTLLHLAAEKEDLTFALYLLEKEVNVNYSHFPKGTPLHIVAKNGNLKWVCLLLKKQADVNTWNNKQLTPVDVASNQLIRQIILSYRDSRALINQSRYAEESYSYQQQLIEIQDALKASREKKDEVEKKISDLESNQKNLENEIADLQYRPLGLPTIVWALPQLYRENGSFKEAFIYSGSTKDKTVHIPFTQIHTKLIHANWSMCAGKMTTPNHIVAHIVFIVSDSPYKKDEKNKYQGGRRLIDFPIALLDYEIGTYKAAASNSRTPPSKNNDHSESALYETFTNNQFVQTLVSDLKKKLSKLNKTANFKIYGCQLFLNSQKNVCNDTTNYTISCETLLSKLMTSHFHDEKDESNSSFLYKLKNQLKTSGFVLPSEAPEKKNNGFPRMFISVSAYEYYKHHCTERLYIKAEESLKHAIQPEVYRYIDTKQLSGNAILSSAEQWIDGKSEKEHSEEFHLAIKNGTAKIPFYTGFASTGARDEKDLLEEYRKKINVDLPHSFDGIPFDYHIR